MTTNATKCQYVFKVILIGNSGVGKTSIINYFRYKLIGDHSKKKTDPTTTVDIHSLKYSFRFTNDNNNIETTELMLWDTAGQEKYNNITKNFFRQAHAVIFCFDLTSRESFDSLFTTWLPIINRSDDGGSLNVYPKCVYAVIGTKLDLCFKFKRHWQLNDKNSYMYLTCEDKVKRPRRQPSDGASSLSNDKNAKIMGQLSTVIQDREIQMGNIGKGNSALYLTFDEYTYSIADLTFFKKRGSSNVNSDIGGDLNSNEEKKSNYSSEVNSSEEDNTILKKKFKNKDSDHSSSRSVMSNDPLSTRRKASLSISNSIEEQDIINQIFFKSELYITNQPQDIVPIFFISSTPNGCYGVDYFFSNLAIELLITNNDLHVDLNNQNQTLYKSGTTIDLAQSKINPTGQYNPERKNCCN